MLLATGAASGLIGSEPLVVWAVVSKARTNPVARLMVSSETISRQIAALRAGLQMDRAVRAKSDGAAVRQAAVLVPVFEDDGDLHFLFIRRSDEVASHRGQVAFPGGRVEAHDADLLAAALREAHEEVGLHPQRVDVLGGFETMRTLTSGIAVAPFVGLIPGPTGLKADPKEVAEIFTVPLAVLRSPRYRGDYEWSRADGTASKLPAILYGGQVIWGLTLRITEHLLEIIAAS